MDFVFLWPWVSFALLLPFIIWRWQRSVPPTATRQALCVPFFRAISDKMESAVHLSSSTFAFLFFIGFAALVAAGMRPVSYGAPVYTPTATRQMMLVLDVSGSMAERDFVLNNKGMTRLGAVKEVARDFLKNRTGDAVGLTIFGTEAYLYMPLTQDVQTAMQMLSETGVGMAGERTAIGDALAVALKQMKDIPSDKKVIVLLSDGSANAGVVKPEEAIDVAKQMGVKIHTIGLGSDKKMVQSFFFVHEVNPSADLDEAMLEKIAASTGGTYFRVKITDDLQKVYQVLDKIEPIDTDGQMIRPLTELFWIPLLVAMLIFMLGFYLKEQNE